MPHIDANGLSFHYQRVGTPGAPPVVMLHGLLIDDLSSLYYTTAPALSDVADVILYDLRGHGLSDQPESGYGLESAMDDCCALLDALGITEPAYFLGNSIGGTIALALSIFRPERVRGLMLIEAHFVVEGWSEGMAQDLELAGYGNTEEDLERWLGATPGRKLQRMMGKAEKLATTTSIVEDVGSTPPMPTEQLQAIACPIVATYGEHSDVVDRARELEALLQHCELDVFMDCSHSVLVEATVTLRDTLREWFERAVRGEALASRTQKVLVRDDEGSGLEHQTRVDGYRTEMARRKILLELAAAKEQESP